MSVQFYNSLTRKKAPFHPLVPGKVSLYTCGPTVYDQAHIGNFRTFLFEDFLKRFLIWKGYQVTHVMNITDVDDKTIRKSQENQVPLETITKKYTQLFFEDLRLLKLIPADVYPTATGHIDVMIDMIQKLLDKGHAYQASDGSIYFDIDSFPTYGQLAHLDSRGQRSTERMQSDEYSKDNPQDFALWKAWKPEDGPVSWESPWGKGRPGWHIECSAMSMKYLGEHFDIHCGGVDNIFPHHENEIAQSVCATGKPFVNLWLHSEHLQVEGGKMSKSLGNYYRLSDLLSRKHTPEAIRYVLLSAHYRTKLNFSETKLREAQRAIQRIVELKTRLRALTNSPGDTLPEEGEAFEQALDDDLGAPQAFAIFFEWLRVTNSRIDQNSLSAEQAAQGLFFIQVIDRLFGILPSEVELPMEVQKLVEEREMARKAKRWDRADSIREQIHSLGWQVEDTPTGPKCRPKY